MKGFTLNCHKVATQDRQEHKKHKKQPRLPPEAQAKKTTEEEQQTQGDKKMPLVFTFNNYSRALSLSMPQKGGVTQQSFFCSPTPV